MKRAFLASLGLLALSACDNSNTGPAGMSEDEHAKRAVELAHEMLIVDTHIDVPYRLNARYEDVSKATETGDFDYPRAVAGGLDAPFMSIYTPASYEFEGAGKAFGHANSMIDLVEKIAAVAPDKFTLAHNPDAVLSAKQTGKMAFVLGMENGAPIEGDLKNLEHFYQRGIRYITLAHSRSNHIADSSYDEERPNDGLSDFGVDVVRAMNDLGIMVDVSHISDAAFWDVIDNCAVPVIASHSSARHFTPNFERNMSDDMIKALADKGGVIMINFGSAFLTEEANAYGGALDAAFESWLSQSDAEPTDSMQEDFEARYKMEHPYPYATLNHVLDHIDHVVEIAGIDAVGIGSDYDGVDDTLPIGLKDVAAYPNLIEGLLARGYDEAAIAKIMGNNLMRVWRAIDRYSKEKTKGA
ncbi:dipeptidase [Iodidimonas muriae]|uniref:Dipeptidase n=1 Tax=Iodidimonas muriae TaxID=261467 RepID=A0ABQ2L8I7_9PROT|nr:dipeptidase [Iodidimonas muriae]GER06426.1 dipeptidase [Kordiimonadales bacterium JCM 17843]GGO04714.1 dipeptidase [Iodidimonas muriae]